MKNLISLGLVLLGVEVLGAQTNNVQFAWGPSPTPGVSNYFLYAGTASGNYNFGTNNVGNALSGWFSNLLSGVTYYFAASCKDYLGFESAKTPEVTYAPPCVFTLSPTSLTISAQSASGNVVVTCDPTCFWTTTNNGSTWVTVAPAGFTGTGSANWTASANTTTNARTAVLTIAGQAFTLTQLGAVPPQPPTGLHRTSP